MDCNSEEGCRMKRLKHYGNKQKRIRSAVQTNLEMKLKFYSISYIHISNMMLFIFLF